MKRVTKLTHKFIDFLPDRLEPGTIYVSIQFATASHQCCCGCGNEVVTPFTPTDWKLTFDGETISLDPSIGNWSFSCQSHYFIKRNQVRWVGRWDRDEIEAGRERDAEAKRKHFAETSKMDTRSDGKETEKHKVKVGLYRKVKNLFRRK